MTTTPLTPEAVASLTDAELSEAVARAVFGATERRSLLDVPENPASWFYAPNKMGGMLFLVSPGDESRCWRILPIDEDALCLVLEHMRQRWAGRGWMWEIGEEATGEDNDIIVWCAAVRSREGWQIAIADSPHLGRATLECALLAAQEMEKEG